MDRSSRDNGGGTQAPVALRRATVADAELILGWRAESAATRFQPLRQLPLADIRSQLAEREGRVIDARLRGDVQWIVEGAGAPVGWISLKDINREHGVGAIGYLVAERYWGRGYATGAVRALLPLAFEDVDLWRLEAVAAVENGASRRVLERAGFRLEGVARALLTINGERVDHARYELLRPDWEQTRADHGRT